TRDSRASEIVEQRRGVDLRRIVDAHQSAGLSGEGRTYGEWPTRSVHFRSAKKPAPDPPDRDPTGRRCVLALSLHRCRRQDIRGILAGEDLIVLEQERRA